MSPCGLVTSEDGSDDPDAFSKGTGIQIPQNRDLNPSTLRKRIYRVLSPTIPFPNKIRTDRLHIGCGHTRTADRLGVK